MVQEPQRPSQLLTVNELATALNVSTHFIYKRTTVRSLDPLPFIPVGRGKRFDLSAVRAHLDSRNKNATGDIVTSNEGIARVNGKALRRMTRKRFQTGSVRLRKDRLQPWWEAFYYLDTLKEDGTISRKRKAVNLGLLSDVPTKRLALRKLSEILSEINDINYKPKSEITFRSFVSKYQELRLQTKKDTTKKGYLAVINKHLLPTFGDKQLADIDSEMVQAFINKQKGEGKEYNTLHNFKFVLSAIFKAARQWKYVKENPVRDVELGEKSVVEDPELPTSDDLTALIEALEEPYSTMVWFNAIAITRPNEGFAFKFSDLNIEECYLTISRGVNRGKFHTPKYHRMNRPLALTRADVDRLLAYKEKMGLGDDDWMFPSKNRKEPLRHEDVLSRRIQPVAKELGLPHVTWRILRKWGSTQMIAGKIAINAAQKRAGHSRPDIMLLHYAQVITESEREAAELLSSKLKLHKGLM